MSTTLPRAKGACSCTTLPRKIHQIPPDMTCKKMLEQTWKNWGRDKPCANEPCKLQRHTQYTHNAGALNWRATNFSLLESSDWKAICCYGDGLLPTRLSAQMHKIITIQSTWKPKRHRQSAMPSMPKCKLQCLHIGSVFAHLLADLPPPWAVALSDCQWSKSWNH